MKPPTCAHHATPPTLAGPANERVPLKTWLSAQNQVQAVTPKGGPAKLAVQCAQPCSTVGQKAYVEVTLLDEQNNPVSASHKTKVEVEWSKSGSSTFSKHDTVEIHPGQDKVTVDWHPDDAGLNAPSGKAAV